MLGSSGELSCYIAKLFHLMHWCVMPQNCLIADSVSCYTGRCLSFCLHIVGFCKYYGIQDMNPRSGAHHLSNFQKNYKSNECWGCLPSIISFNYAVLCKLERDDRYVYIYIYIYMYRTVNCV